MSELVTDYLDGALPWPVRIRARLHLILCYACRRYYDQMRRTVRFLAGAPPAAPPSALEERIMAAMQAHTHSPNDND